jgi:hypothetical protein
VIDRGRHCRSFANEAVGVVVDRRLVQDAVEDPALDKPKWSDWR